jgi:DNA (cytosine-5)-methyltransferase 1
MTKKLKAGALFSGIGGFCIGLKRVGVETIWAVENEISSVETYEANLGVKVIRNGDGEPESIKNIGVLKNSLEPVDILHAGFPCQSFSIAGDRKGFNDPRGQLFYEIVRLLEEFGESRPSVLLLENSPNLKIGEGGSWFSELTNKIKKAGYWFRDANAVELDSYNHTNVPQKRNRLFMVAFATNKFMNGRIDLNLPQLSHQKKLEEYINFDGRIADESYYLDKNSKYWEMINSKVQTTKDVVQLRKYEVRNKGENTVPTLTANMGQGGHNVPFVQDLGGLRKLTEYECLRIQGFPQDFYFPEQVSRPKRYQQIGNAVVPPLISLIGEQIVNKIHAERK